MTKLKLGVLALFALLLLGACGGDSGSIEIEEARYRLAREDLAAGYMTITNATSDAVTLEAVSADEFGRIELHESVASDDGVMSMEPRPDGFTIEAGETISLEPGGKHLMLFDPETSGDDLTLTLDFGDETIEVVAAFDAAASASVDHGDMDDMEDGAMDDEAMDDDAMEMDDTE